MTPDDVCARYGHARRLRLVPITLRDARRFVAQHHSHNDPPAGWLFGVGVARGDDLVAVGVAARVRARALDRLDAVEIVRVATDRTPMACSMIYGHLCSAAKHLGRSRAYTYTLASEPATCVKAAGFVFDGTVRAEDWERPGRPRYATDLFGTPRTPPGEKCRWRRDLVKEAAT